MPTPDGADSLSSVSGRNARRPGMDVLIAGKGDRRFMSGLRSSCVPLARRLSCLLRLWSTAKKPSGHTFEGPTVKPSLLVRAEGERELANGPSSSSSGR